MTVLGQSQEEHGELPAMALVAAQAYLLGLGAVPPLGSSSEDLSTLLMQRARKRAGRYWTPGRKLRKPWPNGKSLEPTRANKMVAQPLACYSFRASRECPARQCHSFIVQLGDQSQQGVETCSGPLGDTEGPKPGLVVATYAFYAFSHRATPLPSFPQSNQVSNDGKWT